MNDPLYEFFNEFEDDEGYIDENPCLNDVQDEAASERSLRDSQAPEKDGSFKTAQDAEPDHQDQESLEESQFPGSSIRRSDTDYEDNVEYVEAVKTWVSENVGFSPAQNVHGGDILFWKLLAKAQKFSNFPKRSQYLELSRLRSEEKERGLPGGILDAETSQKAVEIQSPSIAEILNLCDFDYSEGFDKEFPIEDEMISTPGLRGDQITQLNFEVSELVQSVIIKLDSIEIGPITLHMIQEVFEEYCKVGLLEVQKKRRSKEKRTISELIGKKRFLSNLQRNLETKLGILGAISEEKEEDRVSLSSESLCTMTALKCFRGPSTIKDISSILFSTVKEEIGEAKFRLLSQYGSERFFSTERIVLTLFEYCFAANISVAQLIAFLCKVENNYFCPCKQRDVDPNAIQVHKCNFVAFLEQYKMVIRSKDRKRLHPRVRFNWMNAVENERSDYERTVVVTTQPFHLDITSCTLLNKVQDVMTRWKG
jgi:hypothetical protein